MLFVAAALLGINNTCYKSLQIWPWHSAIPPTYSTQQEHNWQDYSRPAWLE